MTPDERSYFEGLGSRVAQARNNADLTQVQLADRLGIFQPQLASYEVGRRRVPVSMLPRLARLLATPIEVLIGDTDASDPAPPVTPRRTRRGPVARLEQQLDAIARLPKARQRFVSEMLDTVLAQAGRQSGELPPRLEHPQPPQRHASIGNDQGIGTTPTPSRSLSAAL